MLANNSVSILMIICCVIIKYITAAPSYNQPRFCPSATWNPKAITFETEKTVGTSSYSVFVNTNDTVYFTNYQKSQIRQRLNNSINSKLIIFKNLLKPASIFVTTNGDIYVDNGQNNGRVDKRPSNSSTSVPVMSVSGSCYGLFVDINNNIYCSIKNRHQVVKGWSHDNPMTAITIAGTNNPGKASNKLSSPMGIFVGTNFDLYVADYKNDRIQLFQPGQLNGMTVAGNTSLNLTITLNRPSGIVLDADGYLFIVDQSNHRIVRSGPTGFRCLVGCYFSKGPASNQLNKPVTLSFDSLGNMFVTDSGNNRIQKFLLSTNSCVTSSADTKTSNIRSNDTTKLHGEDWISIAPSLATTRTIFVKTTETPETKTFRTSFIKVTEETTSTGTVMTTRTVLVTTTSKSPSNSIFPLPCEDLTRIGTFCSVFNSKCATLQPCQNNGTCQNNENELHGYSCLCPSDFNDTQCQFDHRVCKPNTCWNNGTCVDLLNKTFLCQCEEGWKGTHCEIKINYCDNITCQNNGICRPLLRDYKCECLGDSFSGEHCEITATKIQIYQIASKSFAYIAIIAMISVAMFIVIMDILKYCFGIDPVHEERERLRRKRQAKNCKPVIQRYVYVNTPTPSPSGQSISTTEETAI